MYKVRNTLIIFAYVLLMVLFFFGGYTIGGIQNGDVSLTSTPEPLIVPAVAPNTAQNSYSYEIILSNSELLLYKIDGDTRELLYSHPISENIFPKEDMEELKNGVKFEKLSDAQSLLENFVS